MATVMPASEPVIEQWKAADVAQHALGTVLAVLPYKYALPCGFFFSLWGAGGAIEDVFWRTLVSSFGGMTCLLFFLCGAYEVFYVEREWIAAHPAPKPAAPPPVQVQVTHTEQRGEVTHTEVHEYPNPPSEAFIKWLFERVGTGGRIPGERAIEDEWHEQSDVWLDVLEKEALVQKTGEHKNAPRRIVAGVTKEAAMQRFGYGVKP